MTNYQVLTPHVYRGRGHAARAVGVPYNVYRIGASSTGDVVVPGNLFSSNFYVLRKVKKGGPGFETSPEMKTLWYIVVADTTTFEVGDIFIQNDPVYGVDFTQVGYTTEQFNAFCLAFNPPIGKQAMGARLDRTVQIYRPAQVPDPTNYWVQSETNSTPLVLTNGQFAFSTTPGAVASNVPVGAMPFPRPSGGDQFQPDVPGTTPYPHFYLYVPPLPGVVLKEGDRLIENGGNQFVVIMPWVQEAGIAGLQLSCMRVIAGDGV